MLLLKHSYYGPFATSLRVGDIGYQNSKEGEAGFNVSYNSLQDYIDCLSYAISTPCAKYEKNPLHANGEWQQLNQNILLTEKREEFFEFSLRMSMQHQQWFAGRPLDAEKQARFEAAACASIERQHEIERADDIPFDTFMQNYFQQT